MTAASSVSIVIPAYNAAGTIARAVRSALAEPEATQVIVVDDASADGTAACALAADDGSGRLRILVQPVNAGPSAARNRAMRESVSPWIGILDADDFFLPGRVKRLLAFADRADFIADDAWRVAEDAIDGPRNNLLDQSFAAPRPIGFAAFVASNISDPRRPRGELGFLKPLMRRSFLAAHRLEYRETMRLGEDYELYACALAHGARFYIVPAPGYVSVMRADSLSGRHTETDLLRLRDCDRALAQIPGLKKHDLAALRRHYLSVDCRLQWRRLIGAVKKRDARAALAAFLRPWPVPFYLLTRLAEQFAMRAAKKLGRQS